MAGMMVLMLSFRAPRRNLGFIAGDLSLAVEMTLRAVEMTLRAVGMTAGEVEISVLEAQQPFGIAVEDGGLGVVRIGQRQHPADQPLNIQGMDGQSLPNRNRSAYRSRLGK